MNLLLKSVAPVWLLAVIGALVVGLFSQSSQYLVWLPVVLGTLVIVTFVIQLLLVTPQGFVNRCAASVAGVMVILTVATLVLAPETLFHMA